MLAEHGFRAMVCAILDEVPHDRSDYIEHQLAHDGAAESIAQVAEAALWPEPPRDGRSNRVGRHISQTNL